MSMKRLWNAVSNILEFQIDSQKKFRILAEGLFLLVIVLLVVQFFQYRYINGLSNRVAMLEKSARSNRSAPVLNVGEQVPSISAKDIDGRSETISYKDASVPTVLFIISPRCGWCSKSLDGMKTLVEQKSKEYRFIGISLSEEGLKDYITEHKINFPVYTNVADDVMRTYKLGTTPQTIAISTEGKVLQSWRGAYVENQKTEVEKFFGIALPNISRG
jgi:peroxiredoxin